MEQGSTALSDRQQVAGKHRLLPTHLPPPDRGGCRWGAIQPHSASLGEPPLSVSLGPKLWLVPSSPVVRHCLRNQGTLSPILGLPGRLSSWSTSADSPHIPPTCHLHSRGDSGLLEQRHHKSSRKHDCRYTRPSAHVNWGPSQANSPAGTEV